MFTKKKLFLNNTDQIEILHKLKNGDHAAFEKLFRGLYASLCVYSKKIVLQKEVAEEIIQQIFLKLWESRETLDIHTSLKAYLFKSAHNNSIKYLQSKKFDEAYKKYNEDQLLQKNELIPDFDLKEKINQSLEELPPQCKKIFFLSRFENLKHQEIADQMSISVKTVEVQIRRANIVLRQKLQEFVPLVIFAYFFVRDFLHLKIS